MQVTEINIYPIKSLRGYSISEALVCTQGLEHDRRCMLVDGGGHMITQRECPRLATLVPQIEPGGLRVLVGEGGEIPIPLDASGWTEQEARVAVFGHEYVGRLAAAAINRAFSEALGVRCELLSIRSDIFRTKHDVAFHDDAPLLVIGQASLDDLNARLATSIPMNRFRPNLVIGGGEAFAEDFWPRIVVGETVFRRIKQCERCVIPTVDQNIGEFRGPEPLKTLATYRRKGQNVAFGSYYRPETAGATIHQGDEVRVLETAPVSRSL